MPETLDLAALEQAFENLPSENVRNFVRLLYKVKDKAIEGVGHHTCYYCPVTVGYDVIATSFWRSLEKDDKKKLTQAGWTSLIYNAGLEWYDKGYDCSKKQRERDVLLRGFLTMETLPN